MIWDCNGNPYLPQVTSIGGGGGGGVSILLLDHIFTHMFALFILFVSQWTKLSMNIVVSHTIYWSCPEKACRSDQAGLVLGGSSSHDQHLQKSWCFWSHVEDFGRDPPVELSYLCISTNLRFTGSIKTFDVEYRVEYRHPLLGVILWTTIFHYLSYVQCEWCVGCISRFPRCHPRLSLLS